MADYELTKEADLRLAEIYRYSIRKFGLKTARRYLTGMHQAFALLAENPLLGTVQELIKPGYRRLVYESHVIYYRPAKKGVLIIEVLHEAQDPARHFAT
jgi:toxin ParE1/3/4